ncbi:MAG: ATP-binding cassette domain-containing protein [Candidatus Cloacimonetes bacterium]|nr:ATP-binding cassette domain-containing protein [Candidatus Cloacimonadota bacterium]MCF7813918.1 ATP-binding cassette domain-containing protein [Candidatus Cloacimonadota bacterium]MCF7868515.1 ATP-binding cassette domain-containing protein [Candidatus Cloacimonadota bacterium]MCF7884030.1 ATP-binding cassette domain-containing protein [Candidatus Cloacimonadota bacterium]
MITTIVGESGCGKSVLMKAIEGLIVPTSGSIEIDGEKLLDQNRDGVKRIRKKMAMLFQGSALLDSLDVFQNVALPLKEHTQTSDDEIFEIVEEKLNLVGLENVMHKMPSELSGGMKKRVALARAIILQPDYIIYDEPTTGLDPIIASEITSLIMKLHNNYNITSIVITHDLDCIKNLKSNIAMINDKKIIFNGSFQEFMNSKNEHVRKFSGN